ncbi:MAG: malate synthase [Pseudohongiellaceae bacterium]|jgi:malate synthase
MPDEMKKMLGEPDYHPMSNNLDNSLGFQAAKALIFDNLALPNGYTEPLLHEFRLRAKALQAKPQPVNN